MSNAERATASRSELMTKTKRLAVDTIWIVDGLNPRDTSTQVIARQLVRAATSVGANYRAATRARSLKEMYSKLAIVEEEADEVGYWIELLADTDKVSTVELRSVNSLANEIVAMVVASKKTLASRMSAVDGKSASSTIATRKVSQ